MIGTAAPRVRAPRGPQRRSASPPTARRARGAPDRGACGAEGRRRRGPLARAFASGRGEAPQAAAPNAARRASVVPRTRAPTRRGGGRRAAPARTDSRCQGFAASNAHAVAGTRRAEPSARVAARRQPRTQSARFGSRDLSACGPSQRAKSFRAGALTETREARGRGAARAPPGVRTLLVLNLGLHVVDGVAGLHLQRDGLARQRLDENLRARCLASAGAPKRRAHACRACRTCLHGCKWLKGLGRGVRVNDVQAQSSEVPSPQAGLTRARSTLHVSQTRYAAHAARPRLTGALAAAPGFMPQPLAPLAFVAALVLCFALWWRSSRTLHAGAGRTMVVLGSGACALRRAPPRCLTAMHCRGPHS